MSIIEMIRKRTRIWERAGRWQEPDMYRAVMFMVTEAGEALDALLRRCHPDFWRTRKFDESRAVEHLIEELGQMVMMAAIACEKLDTDLAGAVRAALARMDKKRMAGLFKIETADE